MAHAEDATEEPPASALDDTVFTATPAATRTHSRPPERTRASPRVAIALGLVLTVAGIALSAVAFLGRNDSPPAPTAAEVAQFELWGLDMTAKMFAVTAAMATMSDAPTRQDAMAACAGWLDEVEAMEAVPPAPDAILEREYRASVTELLAATLACVNGDGKAVDAHIRSYAKHQEAMTDRMDRFDPAAGPN